MDKQAALQSTQNEAPLPVVAHVVFPYLFLTGSWIHGQLVHMRQYRPIVLTNRTENLDIFPFNPIYTYENVSTLQKALLCLWKGRLHGASDRFFERILRRKRPCLLHCHFGPIGVAMLELKRRTGLPMVTTFYGADVSQGPRATAWRRYEPLFREGELFLVEGSAMRSALLDLGCPKSKIVVQRLGVNLEALPFVPRRLDPSGVVRILIAGAFREKKGIPDALRAVEQLKKRYPKIEVTLIGDSSPKPGDKEEKKIIMDLVARLNGGISWLGLVPYPKFRAVLYEHHIFLSPSLTASDGDSEGGAPVSIIEAEASGMPIISTRHADIPEVVVDGKSGFLSPERDLNALVENLGRLVGEPERWEAMGHCGWEHVKQNHDLRVQVGRLEQIYSTNLSAI